ncbi:MAG: radical SAM protein [Magnetococcales bacterium]|nr:radical SAM protein [Magnetococcales bacterium]
MAFFSGALPRLAASALTKENPIYVQFYITARCNLVCSQCQVIYANADQEEATTDDCRRIAENLAAVGTSVVLLTGGEPFVRHDLPEIAAAMTRNGIHVRTQTNGLATRKQLESLVKASGCDISVSLDALVPTLQDKINGGFKRSWHRAIRTMADINATFPEDAFAVLGCVLSPMNLDQIPAIIDFATETGWWVSLVPAHTTTTDKPRNFSTYDQALKFHPSQYGKVREVLEQAKAMRNAGKHLYDSDEYLDDIFHYITDIPITWRRRNGGQCDSPNLYFAIQPNGEMAVCCDYRLANPPKVQDPAFVQQYRQAALRDQCESITKACSGCMYGSFPEITISSRFFVPMLRRAKLFLLPSPRRTLIQAPAERLLEIAADVARKHGLEVAR